MECEIMDICLNEALEKDYKIKIIETDKKIDLKKLRL